MPSLFSSAEPAPAAPATLVSGNPYKFPVPAIRARSRRCRRAHQRLLPGPCSVYLLVHGHDQRFKIGLSQDPWLRGWQLPEAALIDWDRCLQAVLPSPERASEVERMLHKALAGFRLDLKPLYLSGWDGSTEWFSLGAFRHALNLLRVTPTDGHLSAPVRLLPIRQPASLAPLMQSAPPAAESLSTPVECPRVVARVPRLSPRQRASQLAGRHNLEQMAAILEMLTMLGWNYPVHLLERQTSPKALPSRVHVHGVKGHWSGESVRARAALTDSEQYVFHTGDARSGRATLSLLRFIRYVDEPGNPAAGKTEQTLMPASGILELELNDLQLIQRLPQGRRIVAQWQLWWQDWQEDAMTGAVLMDAGKADLPPLPVMRRQTQPLKESP